jgi:hypothetical protein
VSKLIIAAFAVFVLAGCALNQSFSGRVAAGYAGLAATNDTAFVLVNAGTISKEDGRAVLEKTRKARETLDIANSVGDLSSLEDALKLLREAQAELCKGNETNPNCALLTQGATP